MEGAIRVDSDEVWKDYVKEGVVKGFSMKVILQTKRETKSINDFLQIRSC